MLFYDYIKKVPTPFQICSSKKHTWNLLQTFQTANILKNNL